MKFIKTAFILLANTVLLTHGQTNTIQFIQAIKQDKTTFYDTEGYGIFLQDYEYNFDEKGINKIKKKFSIPKETQVSEDPDFPGAKILAYEHLKGESKTHAIYYINQSVNEKITVIGFSTLCERVKSIEKELYRAITFNLLPAEVYIPSIVDTIQFAGRSIDLGPACHWRGVRNLQCPDMGQINWSEFSSAERARQMMIGQMALNSEMKMGDVLEDLETDIIFEGTPVKAIKRKLKIKLPQFIMGGSNILIIYYVTAEVRNRYVGCVLSHYTDDIGAQTLPPLLSEVMKLKE
ncbi:MAG: hypothetical protein IPM91_17125 [Bacteroidetes bacterium]|nr:hypothetical protein [Bacteroidota bacterium]